MYIKNALRLLMNNLDILFKAVIYRLIVTVFGLGLAYVMCYFGIKSIISSAQFGAVVADLKSIWLQFLGIGEAQSVQIQTSLSAFVEFLNSQMGLFIGTLIILFVILFATDFLLGLCNYVICAMVNSHMSLINKPAFWQTFVQNFKRACVFELFYSVIKTLYFAVCAVLLVSMIIIVGKAVTVLAVLICLWVLVILSAVFFTFTFRLRPMIVEGEKLSVAIKSVGVSKQNFMQIFTTYIISIVSFAYLNISMFIATLGAGVMVSFPLSYLAFICLQNVIHYTLSRKKYYIDFDNIVVPKEQRSEEEQLLNKVNL